MLNIRNNLFFLGVSDFIKVDRIPYPIGTLDIFRLSKHKIHLFFPAFTKNDFFVFLINKKMIDKPEFENLELRIIDNNLKILGSGKVEKKDFADIVNISDKEDEGKIVIPYEPDHSLIYFKLNSFIDRPGKLKAIAVTNEKSYEIGSVQYHYKKTNPFDSHEIRAIESDPNSVKTAIVVLGCKNCPSKLEAYTSLSRSSELESENKIYQYDLPSEFKCDCGSTNYSLMFLKESLHSLLKPENANNLRGPNYIRMYGHKNILNIIKEFQNLLDKEKDEKPFQLFIENNPVLLSKFHAKSIFVKPQILGKYEPDFAIYDTQKQLVLIELEKPSMRLFKKDSHIRSELSHAYNQVNDWLVELERHPSAFFESFNIPNTEVSNVKGVVIAGRTSNEEFANIQKHLWHPPYKEIEFLTLDDLANSVVEISKRLQ